MDSLTTSQNSNAISLFIQKHTVALLLLAAVVLVVLGIAFAAQASKPGEALYGIKTNVNEALMETLQFSHKNKAQYQVERLKARLAEVKDLSTQENISEKAIADLTQTTTQHTQSLTTHVETSIDSAFPKVEVITTLNEFASVAMAIEILAERDPKFGSFGEHMEDMRTDAVNLYKDRVTSFVQTENQVTVLTYMQENLTEVRDRLEREGVSAEVIDDAENYLDRVATALQDKKLDRAIFSIGEAYRFIQTEAYTGALAQETSSTNQNSTEDNRSTSTEATSTASSSVTQ